MNGWRPPKRKKATTGRHAGVNLDTERRIEAARSRALAKKYKEGERHHARVTTPEFRAGVERMECCFSGCRRWKDGDPKYCPDHARSK